MNSNKSKYFPFVAFVIGFLFVYNFITVEPTRPEETVDYLRNISIGLSIGSGLVSAGLTMLALKLRKKD